MKIDVIKLLKNKNVINKLNKKLETEFLLIFSAMGDLKQSNNKYFFNGNECTLEFSKDEFIINVILPTKLKIYFNFNNYSVELQVIQTKDDIKNNICISSIPNNYFRYSIETKCLLYGQEESKGLEVKREGDFGTSVEYFKKIGESYIRKTETNQEDELPVSLVGISKIDEIEEKLLCIKKLVLFKD